MGIYGVELRELEAEYNHAESSVTSIASTMRDLKSKVDSIKFFDFNVGEIFDKFKYLRKNLEKLSAEVNNNINILISELNELQEISPIKMDESEINLFNTLNKQGDHINNYLQIQNNKLLLMESSLRENNLLGALDGIISDIKEIIGKIVIKTIKVGIKVVRAGLKAIDNPALSQAFDQIVDKFLPGS